MAMPNVPEEIFADAVELIVQLYANKLSTGEFLYLNAQLVNTSNSTKAFANSNYVFALSACYLSPSNDTSYKVFVDMDHTRSGPGGVSMAKTAGNYAAAALSQQIATQNGCSTVLMTSPDGYIDELDTSNLFLVMHDNLITPSLDHRTILPGITRSAIIEIASTLEIQVIERNIRARDFKDYLLMQSIDEAFLTGTARGVGRIASFHFTDHTYKLPEIKNGKCTQLAKELALAYTGEKYFYTRSIGE